MNAPVCSDVHGPTGAYAPPESTRLVIPREGWPFVADALREATRGTEAQWRVQTSAVWIVLPEGDRALHACRVVLAEAGVPAADVDPAAPQCEACGCVDQVACEGGCRWAGINRCTRCAQSESGPRRRAMGALMRRRWRRA